MARVMHRHRNIRLTNLAATRLSTRAFNYGPKTKATARRDAKALATLRQCVLGVIRPAWLDSWLSARLGKPSTKFTAADIQSVLA